MEALFSVCWDGAQAKAEACPAAEGRIRTNENVPVDADQGSDGPADFRSELAARLETGANDRPPCVLPYTPDVAVQGGTDVSSGAGPSVDPDACEVGEAGSKARGKRGVQNSSPADTGLDLPQEVAKVPLVVGCDSLVQGARATEVLADVPAAAVGPETGPANSAVSVAGSMQSGLPPRGMAVHAAAVAAPLSRPGHLATWALQSSTGAVQEADARETTRGLVQAGAGRTFSADGDAIGGVPVPAREQRDAVAPEVPPGAETRGSHEGDAGSRKRAATLFPGAGAKDAIATRAAADAGDTPCRPVLRDEARQADLAAQRVWQGQSAPGDGGTCDATPDGYTARETVPPAFTDGGTWSTALADRAGTTDRLVVEESPGTAKPATAASARESDLGAAGPGSADMASSRTGSAGAYGRSPAVGIGLEIVPPGDAPAWPGQPARRGVPGMTGGPSENPEPASEGGSTTRGVQHRADAAGVPVAPSAGAGPGTSAPDLPAQKIAFPAFQETRLATHGRATDSVSHPPRMEGAKDGAIPVALAEHGTDTTSASRSEGIVMPGPRAQEQGGAALEMTARVLPETHSEGGGRSRGVSVMLASASMGDQAGPANDGDDVETPDAAPGRARDATLARAAMVRADWEGEAGHGKLGVRPGSPVKATSGETPGECRAKVKSVEVDQLPDAQPRPAGESQHRLHAWVGEHAAVAIRTERRGALASDNVPARQPAVEQAAGASEGKASGVESGVEKPVPGCSEASRRWSCEEPTGVTAKRAAGREDAELKLARPAAAASMPDPQELGTGKPLTSGAGATRERQAPITARTVIDQIVQRAQLRLGRSEAEMVIDLKPDVLGRVHLRITAEHGRVVAEIRAESVVTRQLIEAGLGDLKAALADRGLDLGAIAVSGGFGAGVAWNGAKSRWSDDNAGHGPPRAAPGGGGSGAVRQVASFVAARSSPGGVHLVDCVA